MLAGLHVSTYTVAFHNLCRLVNTPDGQLSTDTITVQPAELKITINITQTPKRETMGRQSRTCSGVASFSYVTLIAHCIELVSCRIVCVTMPLPVLDL